MLRRDNFQPTLYGWITQRYFLLLRTSTFSTVIVKYTLHKYCVPSCRNTYHFKCNSAKRNHIERTCALFIPYNDFRKKKKKMPVCYAIIMQPDSQTSIRACAPDNGCGGLQDRSFVTVHDYMAARKSTLGFNSSVTSDNKRNFGRNLWTI